MAYYGQDAVEEVRGATDIVDLIGGYVPLKRKGKSYVGLCPFHTEKTPSFTVDREKQIYYCFGCQRGGDVYSFLMEHERLEFPEALEELARKQGIHLTPVQGAERSLRRDRTLLEMNLEAARFYYRKFQEPEGKEALAYLLSRGVAPELRRDFKLGYAPDSWESLVRHLLEQGYLPQDLARAGLASSREGGRYYDRFRNRLMFPIENARGEIVGFGGRVLGEGEPKYLNSPETELFSKKDHLYGLSRALPEIRRTARALVMEGYMDVLISHQHGFSSAVASLGTALTGEQARLLGRYVSEVVLAYDSDEAGKAATIRAAGAFARTEVLVRVAELGDAKDPDDFIRRHGTDAFETLLERALPFYEYLVADGLRRYSLGRVQEKVALTRFLIPHLAAMENRVTQAEYVKYTAGKLDLAEDSLRFEIRKYLENQRLPRVREGPAVSPPPGEETGESPEDGSGIPAEEIALLRICLRNPAVYRELSGKIGQAGLSSPFAIRCFREMEQRGYGEERDVHRLLAAFEGEEHRLLVRIAMEEREPANVLTAVAWLDRIRSESLRKEGAALEKEMEFLEKEGDFEALREVQRRFQSLQEERKSI